MKPAARRLAALLRAAAVAACSAAMLLPGAAPAAPLDYDLRPRLVAPDTYVVEGRNEDFSTANGGNIVNTAFVVTGAGVVVVDTGPSRRYGEALLAAIAQVTPEPVARVFITHQHPDHFLGAQAFPTASLEALPGTIAAIAQEGDNLNANMYRLNGDWMAGTEVVTPTRPAVAGEFSLGRHRFRLLALAGHTGADLALFDATTGALFAGDLAFHDRAPTTPHARIKPWLAALDTLSALPLTLVVPGHGAVSRDATPLRQTRAYLVWLEATLEGAAAAGLDMGETLALPLPPEVRSLAVARNEYRRSVGHLFPALEAATLEHRP